jgi:hypothetical protein
MRGMARQNKRKFYCYVDESGQDTSGQLFVVSVIVTGREARDQLERGLEQLEQSSGKRTSEYEALTTLTIAEAVNAVAKADYRVTIVIDGLSTASRQRVTRELRRLKIAYDKVVGGREQSSALLRLADALAGLMRDFWEGQSYARDAYNNLVRDRLLVDLHKE